MALKQVTLANESHRIVDGTLAVSGLAEVTAALRALEPDVAKELRGAMKAIAQHVVGVADQRMPWGPPSLHVMQSALRASGTTRGAAIGFPAGGADSRDDPLGYYPWLDFGGTTGRGRVSAGFSIDKRGRAHASHAAGTGGNVRPVVKGGRYLYPAIGESKVEIADEAYKAIETAAHRNQFDTRNG